MSVSLRRGAVGLALASALVAGLAPASHADTLEDTLLTHELQLGDVCREGTKTGTVGFALKRAGAGNNNNVNASTWANGTVVTVAPKAPIPGLTLGTTSVTTPSDWTSYANNETYPAGTVSVGVAVPKDSVLGATSAAVVYTATGTSATGASNEKGTTVTLRWTVVDCAPKDTTAPKITRALSPEVPSGTGGWYREDVTVDWTVTDAESAVTGTTGCAHETFTTDGTHKSSCSATSAGGTAGPVEATVSIDRTPPVVEATVNGTIGDNGWYTGDVTVSWTIDDATSGIASASPDCRGTTLTADTVGETYTCTVFDRAGNKTEIVKDVKRDATKPAISSAVSGATGNGGWYVGDVTVDWTVSDDTSELASTSGCDDLVVTTDTNGTDYTCSATDNAGNSDSSTVPVKRDTAGPVVTYSLAGTQGSADWHRGPVTVTWSANDGDGSGLAQGCASETVSGDRVHLPECTAYDVAGNATASQALVQIDATEPVITPTVVGTRTLPGSDWYTSDVSVTWEVSDATSTVATTSGCDKVDVVDDTAGTTYTCSATDVAGNADSQSVTVKRDATAPVLTLAGGPADGATYDFGDVPAPSTCTASDATSGLAGACTVEAGGTAVGAERTQVATVTDQAGNVATETRTYAVAAWRLDGFYKPVTMGTNVVNTVKAGSTVPLKFNVYKGGAAMASGIGATFTTTKVGCETGDVEDVVDFVTTGATALRYDGVAGQWVQNWATPGAAKGACYRVTMKTADGSSIVADFKLK